VYQAVARMPAPRWTAISVALNAANYSRLWLGIAAGLRCRIRRRMRTLVITAEEGGNEPGHLRGAVEQEQVTSTPDDVQSCVRGCTG